MRGWLWLLIWLALTGFLQAAERPRLICLIVVDQLRADTLTRFRDLFLPARSAAGPGGFRFLQDEGAHYSQCFIDTLPCHTATGHACIATGAEPSIHGIVGNNWLDPQSERWVEATDDARVQPPISPVLMQGSTLGDEMKLASNGRSRVFAVAVKARAAVLLAGHSADGAYWVNTRTGKWESSSYYPSTPAWLDEFNRAGWIEGMRNWSWEPLLDASAYTRSRRADAVGAYPEFRRGFPHKFPYLTAPGQGDKTYYDDVCHSPLGHEWTRRVTEQLLISEKLGQDEHCDLLCVSFSTYDKVGHSSGPYSPEMQDLALRLDRDLSQLFGLLDRQVGLDNCLFVLTSDHGGAPVPEQRGRMVGGRVLTRPWMEELNQELVAHLGEGNYVLGFSEPHLTLNHALLGERLPQARQLAAQWLRRQSAVQGAWSRDDIAQGRLPQTPLGTAVARSYFEGRSGDVFVVHRAFWVDSARVAEGSNHGAPFTYDTHIPLLIRAAGIVPGVRRSRCSQRDIAPTLCEILGISPPSGCLGRVLEESLPPGQGGSGPALKK